MSLISGVTMTRAMKRKKLEADLNEAKKITTNSNTTNICMLNDDCLLKIFYFLSIKGLSRAAKGLYLMYWFNKLFIFD